MYIISFFFFFIEAASRISMNVLNVKDLNFLFPYFVAGEFLLLVILFIRKLALPQYLYVPMIMLAAFFLLDTGMVANEVKK
uniref:Uncharacterized protein n=1 Tax=Chryseobacterium endophyticum TaxID=1854762 RepID=A0AAU6WQL1_9FLAO